MLQAIKGLVGSKKFWLNQLGLPHDIIMFIGGLFGANVVAQGIADKK